jgi:hypothetical protein
VTSRYSNPTIAEVGARHLPIALLALLYEKNFVQLSPAKTKTLSTGLVYRGVPAIPPGRRRWLFVLAGSFADNRSWGPKPLR